MSKLTDLDLFTDDLDLFTDVSCRLVFFVGGPSKPLSLSYGGGGDGIRASDGVEGAIDASGELAGGAGGAGGEGGGGGLRQ